MGPITQNSPINHLPYAKGAARPPEDAQCLGGTREALLDDIQTWIRSIDAKHQAEIFWLTGVAGAGKTVIAHTVAKHCRDQNLLCASFFFSQDVAGRNDPRKLFSTIARNLAERNVDFRRWVDMVLESDRELVGASPSVHFREFILRPSQRLPTDQPVIVIIDALDEGCSEEVLKILRDEVPRLPRTF